MKNMLFKGVDGLVKPCYTTCMEIRKAPRKKRSDRTHIVYELDVNGLKYIGVTAKTETTPLKSAKTRAAKHFYRAKTESKEWLLCLELRKLTDKTQIGVRVLATVRGKQAGHDLEVELRRKLKPELNTDTRGD
jgi:hypothetical protein